MRVADKMAFNQVTQNLSKNRTEMNDLQNKAATQKRINKPSDDPAASARVLAARTEERASKQFQKNINVARSFLEFTDQSLSELTESLIRAKELAIQQSSDAGASPDTRRTAAAEVEQIYNQTVQIANRKLGERYVFGGYKTNSAPFDISGEYHGDDGDIKLQINKDAFVAMNVSGDKVFQGKGLGADGLIRYNSKVPKDAGELRDQQAQDLQKEIDLEMNRNAAVPLRGPASTTRDEVTYTSVPDSNSQGTNILNALRNFEIALKTNDKVEVQSSVDELDAALTQVVNTRAQVGSRVTSLNSAYDSLQKSILDQKGTASQLEDADLFEVVSDMNKTDSTLKATLETSGKVMNMSLLDFLR
ncbi:MAG: flagellar hook-associated protein 3 [Bdellovibrio sp. CG10_big_fil_rev_8_21_14_0_10_47_8]|nr:MAG: flagellar hook-associated protein 3 [Bdellovibrio sp. CG10_big_fil_rev_8_21_14_0_10_47_8]